MKKTGSEIVKMLSSYVEKPIETNHVFTRGKDDFLCAKCGRARAFHSEDGFKQSQATIFEPAQPKQT